MRLAKKGICVFSWIYSGKNAYALFGHQAIWKGKSALQRSLPSHRSKGPWWKKCQNQKGRTGHGEMAALLHWWAGCKLPKATLEKCTVCPETSKKHSLETIGYFHSWVYKLGKLKISKTQEPQSLGLLCWPEPPLHYTLHILGKRKVDKELVVLMYNGISLSHGINVIRLVAALWVDLGTTILTEISHTENIVASPVAEQGSRRAGSVVVAHGPSRSAARGIFPDQGSNPCPLHWQADS